MWTPDASEFITAEQKQAAAQETARAGFQNAIQAHVDAVARSRSYADGKALAGYTVSTVPQWAAEAQAFVAWRDAVWLHAYAELAKVEAGERPVPASPEDFIAELPAIIWPE